MLRADIYYVGVFVLKKLGVATELSLDVLAGESEIRVVVDSMFEPAGGQCVVADTDNVITYSGVKTNVLVGVPPSGTGSIAADLRGITDDVPSVLVVENVMTLDEVETALDQYRQYRVVEVLADATKTRFKSRIGWIGDLDDAAAETVELRTSPTGIYDVVTEDERDEEIGEFLFDTPVSYDRLYAVGYFYNPYHAIAELIDTLHHTGRWYLMDRAGQLSHRKRDAGQLANYWRARGAALNF